MSDSNTSISGAFSGETKYFFLLMIAASIVLFGCMFGSIYIAGIAAASIGMFIGLFLAAGVFVGGWLLIYITFQQKNIPFQHFMIIIRLSQLKLNNNGRLANYVFFTHHVEKGKAIEEIKNGKPTGWRSKTFELMEPIEFEPGYGDFGVIEEFTIQYYGSWKDLVNMQPGVTEYKDMSIPVGSFDILTVEPVQGAISNIKHGARSPIFRLIGGGYEANYANPEALIPNPNTHLVTTNSGASTALKVEDAAELETLRREVRELKAENIERRRQSQEDKAHADMNEQYHILDSAENESFKDLAGEAEDTMIDIVQGVIAFKHSWEGGLAWFQRNQRKPLDQWKWVIISLAVFFGVLIFLGVQPQLLNQAIAAVQNPIFDVTLIGIVLAFTIGFIYWTKRRRVDK